MSYVPEAIYLDKVDKRKILPEVKITIAGQEYIFPINVKVPIPENVLKIIIGNWDNPTERDKNIIWGMTSPDCPRTKIYRVVGNQAVNLFGVIELEEAPVIVKEKSLEEASVPEPTEEIKAKRGRKPNNP